MEQIGRSAKYSPSREIARRRTLLRLPYYSLGEEIFSSVSHGVGAVGAVASYVVLLLFCRKEPLTLFSVHCFGISMILLYSVSTLYHGLGVNRAKKLFRVLDHCSIFLLIAGTYTPISLLAVGGTKGWVLLATVWAAALLGILINCIRVERFAKISMLCYLAMGWAILFALDSFLANTSFEAFLFLGLGGVLYSLGAVVYLFGKKVPYMHSVWHLFVLCGSLLHAVSIFFITSGEGIG
jgi:hemolysin III